MTLCDIGNTNVHMYKNGKIQTLSFGEFKTYKPDEIVYYINVNKNIQINQNYVNLEHKIKFKSTYANLGIDRIFACYSIKSGIIVDSGSATTIDVMNNGVHLGGVILPGLEAYLKTYEMISSRLKCTLNTQISLDTLPQNTKDAISYGIIKSTINIINDLSDNKIIYFTGGNGAFLSRFFKDGVYDKNLVFSGMLKFLQEENLC